MKIVHKATYDVERMTVKEYLADHQYRKFMITKNDIPSYWAQNIAWLESLKPTRKLYVVNDCTETTEVIR